MFKIIPICILPRTVKNMYLIETKKTLQAGEISGAGLDVMTPEPIPPNHELTKLPNVFLTPHIATSTRETRLKMINLAVDNILAGLQDKPMPTRLC